MAAYDRRVSDPTASASARGRSPAAPRPPSRGRRAAVASVAALVVGILAAVAVTEPDDDAGAATAGGATPGAAPASGSPTGSGTTAASGPAAAAPEAAGSPAPSGSGTTTASVAESAGRDLVAGLERAWAARDERAFLAAAAPDRAGRRAASDTWDALAALDVETLDLRWLDAAVPPRSAPTGTAVAVVEARWQQAGWDGAATAVVEVVLGVDDARGPERPAPAGRLVDVTPAAGEPAPLWAMAPLQVRTTATDARVVALDGLAPGDRLTAAVARADREVGALLPGRGAPGEQLPGRGVPLVVVAPASASQFADLVGDRRDYGAIAAVTTTVDGSVRVDTAVQVLLNPSVFDRLRPAAAQVVLAHEATHVATGASTATMPLWVAEGFADFAALRSGDVPVRVAAGRAIAAVRRDGPPAVLPRSADFGTEAHALGRTYELAWLAFHALDREVGTRATVRFHDAVAAGVPTDRALHATTGLGVARLTGLWRDDLRRLAGDVG